MSVGGGILVTGRLCFDLWFTLVFLCPSVWRRKREVSVCIWSAVLNGSPISSSINRYHCVGWTVRVYLFHI